MTPNRPIFPGSAPLFREAWERLLDALYTLFWHELRPMLKTGWARVRDWWDQWGYLLMFLALRGLLYCLALLLVWIGSWGIYILWK